MRSLQSRTLRQAQDAHQAYHMNSHLERTEQPFKKHGVSRQANSIVKARQGKPDAP